MTAPLLILLPGLDGTGALFDALLAELQDTVPTLVVSYPKNIATYEEHIAFVRPQLPHDRPFALLGESFSGPVAITLAAERHPGLVGIVLCATFASCPSTLLERTGTLLDIFPPIRPPAALLSALLLGTFATHELRARMMDAVRSVPVHTLISRLKAVARVNVTTHARKVLAPCLYLQAAQDRLVGAAAAERMRLLIPHMECTRLEGPHLLLQASATHAATQIAAFMERLRR